MAPSIAEKLSMLRDQWKTLQDLTTKRRNDLQTAYTRHKFCADLKELQDWLEEAISRMKDNELPTTVSEAEAAINLHEERKAEIDGRQKKVQTLKDFGLKLISNGNDDELKSSLDKLEELQIHLNEACEERRKTLQQALQLALFRDQADQAERWLFNKEAFLNNDDLGDSLTGVDALIQKHEAFEKTIAAQSSRIEDLKKFAKEIISDKHYDESGIESRLKMVTSRRDKLEDSSEARKKKLLETKKLLQFLRNMYEVGVCHTFISYILKNCSDIIIIYIYVLLFLFRFKLGFTVNFKWPMMKTLEILLTFSRKFRNMLPSKPNFKQTKTVLMES